MLVPRRHLRPADVIMVVMLTVGRVACVWVRLAVQGGCNLDNVLTRVGYYFQETPRSALRQVIEEL